MIVEWEIQRLKEEIDQLKKEVDEAKRKGPGPGSTLFWIAVFWVIYWDYWNDIRLNQILMNIMENW